MEYTVNQYNNVLTESDINYLLSLPEVLKEK